MSTTNTSTSLPAAAIAQYRFLERDPLSCSKQLSIRGRRIKASTIFIDYNREEEPMTPEQIAEDRELPLEAVLEAIAYCQSNPPEVEADRRRQRALDEMTGRSELQRSSGPAKMLTAQELARIFDE